MHETYNMHVTVFISLTSILLEFKYFYFITRDPAPQKKGTVFFYVIFLIL